MLWLLFYFFTTLATQVFNPPIERLSESLAVPSAHSVASAVDIDINPCLNRTYTSRLYQCKICDATVDLREKGIVCETCDQWYHAMCQNVHSISYKTLQDPNISLHCIIRNSPNYSSTVLDLHTTLNLSDSNHVIVSGMLNTSDPYNLSDRKPFQSSAPFREQKVKKTTYTTPNT